MSLPPLSKVRCCRSKKIGQLPEGLPQQPLATHQPIQNRTILLSFRRGVFVCACMVLHPCLVSRQCRCVLQRLSVADFKHPCLKLCAHTLKASVPCLPLPLHQPSPSPQPSQNHIHPHQDSPSFSVLASGITTTPPSFSPSSATPPSHS